MIVIAQSILRRSRLASDLLLLTAVSLAGLVLSLALAHFGVGFDVCTGDVNPL